MIAVAAAAASLAVVAATTALLPMKVAAAALGRRALAGLRALEALAVRVVQVVHRQDPVVGREPSHAENIVWQLLGPGSRWMRR